MRALVVAIAILASPALTRAQDAPVVDPTQAEAQALFRRGVELGELDRWADALEHFRRSRDIAPRPNTVFNIAFASYRLGRFAEAVNEFDQYLALTEGEVSERRDEAMRLRGESIASLAEIRLELEPPSARLSVDGRPSEGTEPVRVLALDPGRHVLHASAEGYEEGTLALSVLAGEHGERRLVLAPRAAIVIPEEPPPPGTTIIEEPLFWVIAGVVVVGAAVGIGVGVAVSSPGEAPRYGGSTGVVLDALRF